MTDLTLRFECDHCENRSLKINSRKDPLGNLICKECFLTYFAKCSDCFRIVDTDDLVHIGLLGYCDNCWHNHGRECANCGDIEPFACTYVCSSCEDTICLDCSDHGCIDSEQNQSIEFQEGKYTPFITVDRFVGVELEAECGDRRKIKLPKTFGIKEDGSLDDTGVEIVTPPSKRSALVSNVKLACEQLKKAGFEATSNAGLHVHIDLRDIKDDFTKLSRIMRTFFAVEDVIFSMLPKERRESEYCYPLRRYYRFYDFYGTKLIRKFDETFYNTTNKGMLASLKTMHGNDRRYRSCNFHSIFFRGTLEVRAHSSSQNPIKIFRWIELLLKIVQWSTTNFSQRQVEELLKMRATKKKVDRMRRVFKFSKEVEKHINSRAKHFGQEGLDIPYKLGSLPKSKQSEQKELSF